MTGSGICSDSDNVVLELMHHTLLPQCCQLPNQKASDTSSSQHSDLHSGYTELVPRSSRPWKLHHGNCHRVLTYNLPTLKTPTGFQQLLCRSLLQSFPTWYVGKTRKLQCEKLAIVSPPHFFPPPISKWKSSFCCQNTKSNCQGNCRVQLQKQSMFLSKSLL